MSNVTKVENMLFEVYNKGVLNLDCDLTHYAKKLQETNKETLSELERVKEERDELRQFLKDNLAEGAHLSFLHTEGIKRILTPKSE